MRHLLAIVAGVLVGILLALPSARAEGPEIVTREHGGWGEALAALRGDLGSEGRAIHIGVRAGGKKVGCDHYRLDLDDAAQGAFQVGVCDRGTEETTLKLAHRAALFDHRTHVPSPRTLSLRAVVTYEGAAVGDGGPQGGSAVRCSWAVRPYLDDQEHGTRVLLTPEHYALRSASAWVSATPDGSGWNLAVSEAATFHLEYEVVDRATGGVVLRQALDMRCGDAGPTSEAPRKETGPAEQKAVVEPPVRYDLRRSELSSTSARRGRAPCRTRACVRAENALLLWSAAFGTFAAGQAILGGIALGVPDPEVRKAAVVTAAVLTVPTGMLATGLGVSIADVRKSAWVRPSFTFVAGGGTFGVGGGF